MLQGQSYALLVHAVIIPNTDALQNNVRLLRLQYTWAYIQCVLTSFGNAGLAVP